MPKWWPFTKRGKASASSTQLPSRDIFSSKGDEYVERGEYTVAVTMYTEALKEAPSDSNLLTSRSLAYMMSTPPELDLALKDADAAIQLDPENMQAWLQRGETLVRKGEYNNAEEALVNATGLAKGRDRITAQRSLADVRSKRDQIPSTPVELPSASMQVPTPESSDARSFSVSGQPLTSQPSRQDSNTTPTLSGSLPPIPNDRGQTSTAVESQSTTSQAPNATPTTISDSTPPIRSPSDTRSTSYGQTSSVVESLSVPGPSRLSQSTTASRASNATPTTLLGSTPPTTSPSNIPTIGLGRFSSVFRSSNASGTASPPASTVTSATLPGSERLSRGISTPSTSPSRLVATPSISTAAPKSFPGPSNTQSRATPTVAGPSSSSTPSSQSPPVQQATVPTVDFSGIVPRILDPRLSGGTSQNTTNPSQIAPPITRTEATIPNVPLNTEDLLNLTSEAPPSYTPNLSNPDPTVRALSEQAITAQLTQLQAVLGPKNKGSLAIKPFTASGSIDAVRLIYVGMTQLQLTAREYGTPTYLHPTFRGMAIRMFDYPGNTFLDMDCESSQYYDGKLPGTVNISGYSEEYREDQLLKYPILNIALEGTETLPEMELSKIVQRLQLLQRQPTVEDNEALRGLLGLSQVDVLQSGWRGIGGRQRQIEAISMALNRSLYEAPTRFIDFSKARTFSSNTLGSATQGIGLRNFLFQILLGAELLIRLRKEPITVSYAGLMTNSLSALVVLADLWMQNVIIQGPRERPTTPLTTAPSPLYLLVAIQHRQQAEGLIRFGEAMSWPYMDEARSYIENAYQDLLCNKVVGFDICDWLYGLILPGKVFRHRIMSCLVYASPTIRSLSSPPFYDSGLVVKNKSYWPRRTVLGRVLGGLKNPKSVCGWIGPVPAPLGDVTGWVLLNARRVDIPVPVNTSQTSLQHLGFGQPDGTESAETTLQSIMDPNEWIQGSPPSRPATDPSHSVFKGIYLDEMPSAPASVTTLSSTGLARKEYRASLEFEVDGTLTRYTLYSNPLFVYAPPCVGTHVMHRRQAQTYLGNVIRVADLKEAYPANDSVVIIDALGPGEEVVARAWCAERARHAVIRRDAECCFTCAITVVAARTGLGVNVLIWSR